MSELPPQSVSAVQADRATDNQSSPLRLVLPRSEREFPKAFVAIYEHFEALRENGHIGEANSMHESTKVLDLIGIATDEKWKLFDTIWSAKDFREALYHAIGPKHGGPLWLRESVKPEGTEDMCMTLMPHVWKTLFDQAKDFTNIFVDPRSPGHARILQQITRDDMTKLKVLWSGEDGTLSLDKVVSKFFPKPKRGDLIHRSTSQVTKNTYVHSVTLLTNLDPEDYIKAFDCLARYAVDQTPLPSFVNWEMLIKLAHEVGRVTKDVLRHIAFWFMGVDHAEVLLLSNAPVSPWSELLDFQIFNNGSLVHEDKTSSEAAQHFIQALFDQIRVGFDDWKDEAAKNLAAQTPINFHQKVRFLSPDLQSVCYRDRFRFPAWHKVLDLYKSYVGSRFEGVMKVYDTPSTASDGHPRILLQSAIEQSLLAAGLQDMGLPFLESDEALRALTSEIEILTAVYLYPRCKLFAISNHEGISDQISNLGDGAQHVSSEQDQKVQMILKETTRILRDAGYDPQPDFQDEHLGRFCLRRPGFILAESNNHQTDEITNHLESNTANPVALTGTTPSGAPNTLTEEPAATSTNIPSGAPNTLTEEPAATSTNIPSGTPNTLTGEPTAASTEIAPNTLTGESEAASINDFSNPYEQEHQTRSRKRSLLREESLTEALSSTSIDDEQEGEARSRKRHKRKHIK